jgi:hypothetical protein
MASRGSHLALPWDWSARLGAHWTSPWARLVGLPRRARQRLQGRPHAAWILLVLLQIAMIETIILLVAYAQGHMILAHTRAQALVMGVHLAALQEGALLSYDYAKLEQAAAKVGAIDEDLAYLIAHLYDGRIAAFSGHAEVQGQRLDDPLSRRALQAVAPLVQEIVLPQTVGPGYEVAIPVYVPGSAKKWGTIRLGVSLTRAYSLIHHTRRALWALSLGTLIGGLGLILLRVRLSSGP